MNGLSVSQLFFISSLKNDKGESMQGHATDMDWTLQTDLWKSETNRDVKKSFLYHWNIFKKCIDFQI